MCGHSAVPKSLACLQLITDQSGEGACGVPVYHIPYTLRCASRHGQNFIPSPPVTIRGGEYRCIAIRQAPHHPLQLLSGYIAIFQAYYTPITTSPFFLEPNAVSHLHLRRCPRRHRGGGKLHQSASRPRRTVSHARVVRTTGGEERETEGERR